MHRGCREWVTRRAWVTTSSLDPTEAISSYSGFGFPWEIINVQNPDPSMAQYASYNLLTKGGDLTGYHSASAVVPELNLGIFAALSTGGM